MKLTPASREAPTSASTSAPGSLPMASQKPLPPKVMVPRQISETKRPVFPRGRYRMADGLAYRGSPSVSEEHSREVRERQVRGPEEEDHEDDAVDQEGGDERAVGRVPSLREKRGRWRQDGVDRDAPVRRRIGRDGQVRVADDDRELPAFLEAAARHGKAREH